MRRAKSTLQHLLLVSGGEEQAEESAKNAVDLEDHDETCIICMDAPREVVFRPCGHNVVCTDCSKLVMASGGLCPMCRDCVVQAST